MLSAARRLVGPIVDATAQAIARSTAALVRRPAQSAESLAARVPFAPTKTNIPHPSALVLPQPASQSGSAQRIPTDAPAAARQRHSFWSGKPPVDPTVDTALKSAGHVNWALERVIAESFDGKTSIDCYIVGGAHQGPVAERARTLKLDGKDVQPHAFEGSIIGVYHALPALAREAHTVRFYTVPNPEGTTGALDFHFVIRGSVTQPPHNPEYDHPLTYTYKTVRLVVRGQAGETLGGHALKSIEGNAEAAADLGVILMPPMEPFGTYGGGIRSPKHIAACWAALCDAGVISHTKPE